MFKDALSEIMLLKGDMSKIFLTNSTLFRIQAFICFGYKLLFLKVRLPTRQDYKWLSKSTDITIFGILNSMKYKGHVSQINTSMATISKNIHMHHGYAQVVA